MRPVLERISLFFVQKFCSIVIVQNDLDHLTGKADFQPLFPDDDATRPRDGAVPSENFDLGTTAHGGPYIPPSLLTNRSFIQGTRATLKDLTLIGIYCRVILHTTLPE